MSHTEHPPGPLIGSKWLVAFRAMILVLEFATVRRTVGVELVRKAHMDFLAREEFGRAPSHSSMRRIYSTKKIRRPQSVNAPVWALKASGRG